jgi:hypothetical protein
MNKSCEYCYEDFNQLNKVFTSELKDYLYNICSECLKYQKINKINHFVSTLRKEDCLATIKRMLNSGIPLYLDENINIFYLSDNTSISSSYFEKERINEIIDINKKLKNLLQEFNDEIILEKINHILDQFF